MVDWFNWCSTGLKPVNLFFLSWLDFRIGEFDNPAGAIIAFKLSLTSDLGGQEMYQGNAQGMSPGGAGIHMG
jgi:hypothetical protein